MRKDEERRCEVGFVRHFDIWISSFLRHLDFDLRHSGFRFHGTAVQKNVSYTFMVVDVTTVVTIARIEPTSNFFREGLV